MNQLDYGFHMQAISYMFPLGQITVLKETVAECLKPAFILLLCVGDAEFIQDFSCPLGF